MAATTYTVKKGDTLSEIAVKYNTTVDALVKLNDIDNPNLIAVGQVLTIKSDGSSSGSTTTKKKSSSKVTIKQFGLQSNTDRTIFATWKWDKSNTDNYEAIWYYDTGDGIWFEGSKSTVDIKQSTYDAPTKANRVKFIVKPISKTYKSNDKDVHYWTASYSTAKIYDFADAPPTKPSSAPTVKIDKFKLTAELDNIDLNATKIEFYVVRNNTKFHSKGTATIKAKYAAYSCTVTAGSVYKVRCRAVRGKLYSEWTDFSSNVGTVPSTPKIVSYKARTEDSIFVDWGGVTSAEKYEVQYTTNKGFFSSSPNDVKSITIEHPTTHAELTGLEIGQTWFFRLRAVNSHGNSEWTEIKSIALGKPPTAPTTWSSTSTARVDEIITLYWTHNAEDGSKPTYAELEVYANGEKIVETIPESELDYTSSVDISAADKYPEGVKFQWRVRTAGVTKEYGDWSVQRTINVYTPPTLSIDVTNKDGESIDIVETFPFYLAGSTGPDTQSPVGYHVMITSKYGYVDVDNTGATRVVDVGDAVYEKFFDTNEDLLIGFHPYNINLRNNMEYEVTCVASMDSGLTAEAETEFEIGWSDEGYEPNASISIDTENLVAHICPVCEDENGELIDGFLLSVYRIDATGALIELATDLDSLKRTFITDPHPALDYARYRVVATSSTTGAVSYYDIPAYPVGEKSIVFNFGEQWYDFNVENEDRMEEQPWSGTLLKFPYNVDISESNEPDVEMVEYIGRKHPVSYYGTHVGSTASWNASIPKDDTNTIQALRRLSEWMGDVYVREPSGSGYWANVKTSFGQTHCETSIPVSFEITRVEGGI